MQDPILVEFIQKADFYLFTCHLRIDNLITNRNSNTNVILQNKI